MMMMMILMVLLTDVVGGRATYHVDEKVAQLMRLLLAVASTLSSLAGKRRTALTLTKLKSTLFIWW